VLVRTDTANARPTLTAEQRHGRLVMGPPVISVIIGEPPPAAQDDTTRLC
jgi:hypothetical protein